MKILKEKYSVSVSRNTISDDLAMLHDCGLHIEHYESTQNKYYYDGHIYELPELKGQSQILCKLHYGCE